MAEAAYSEALGAHTEVVDHAGEGAHLEPAALGLTPGAWVALSMLVLIGIAIWKKVPGMITSGLDSNIAQIKKQLDEAKALRSEAESLRKEYADKISNAERDAAEMIENARREADAIIAKAEVDTTEVMARREKMAADKIAAAERAAIAELRAKAAMAATAAARALIARNYSAEADKAFVNQAISEI